MTLGPGRCVRAVVAGTAALALATAITPVRAQNPWLEARPAPAWTPPPPADAAAVVRAFVDGCVAHEGESIPVVDWALNQGFDAGDAHGPSGAALLAGRPGTVLLMAGSGGSVVLAVDFERSCTVWAERADGPAVRAALQRAMGELASRGAARLEPAIDRTVERAGAWRQQTQWRLRRVGGTRDFLVGAVTTLATQPSAQALNLTPVPSRLEQPATDPTGLPLR